MTARVAASHTASRPLVGHGGSTGRRSRARRTDLARSVIAGIVAATLTGAPAATAAAVERFPAPAEDAVRLTGLEYAPGSDVYLVSRTDLGESGDPSLTPDGQGVAFVSTARDLAGGSGTGVPNVFLATASTRSSDPFSGTPRLVSAPDRALPQVAADGGSGEPVISADGRYVAFVSLAANLVPGGSAAAGAGIYLRDTDESTTIRLDVGSEAGTSSRHPGISADGRYVVFESDAVALSPGDANDAPDVFVADTDADGNGIRGDVSVTRLLSSRSVPGGLSEPAISGDGEWIVATGHVAEGDPGSPAPTPSTNLMRIHRETGEAEQVLGGARAGAVDASGRVVAGVSGDCAGAPAVVAATLDDSGRWYALRIGAADSAAGSAPAVSADGSRIAFVDAAESAAGPTAPGAVVRVAAPRWPESHAAEAACPPDAADVTVVGPGESVALSASGRTVAVAGAGDMSVADRSVVAVDLHTHDGLSVTNAMRGGPVPRYLTGVEIEGVAGTALLDEAGELAALELGRLHDLEPAGLGPELSRLPLDRLPLGAAALADLPLEITGLPGGWHALLPATPFADDVAEHVTLRSIVEWAGDLEGATGSGEEAAVAATVRSIRLGDISLSETLVGTLSPASLLLGDVPLAELAITASADPLDGWRAALQAQRVSLDVTDETVLIEADAAGLDLGTIGLEGVPAAAIAGSSAPAEPGTTVGAALFSLVPPGDYPWEAFDPAALPADVPSEESAADCADAACGGTARFRFTFDPGPGEPTRFPDAAASVRLPATTLPASILVGEAGPASVIPEQPYRGTVQGDGPLVELPLGDGIGGTTRSVSIDYTASRGLGDWETSATLRADGLVARDAVKPNESQADAATTAIDGGSGRVDPAAAPVLAESGVRYGVLRDDGDGAPADEDWYRIATPAAGQRVVIAAGSADQGLTVTLLEPSSATTPLGVPARRDAPSRAVPGDPGLAIGSGFGPSVDGYDVVDVARSPAGGSARVDTRWTDVDSDGAWLVRVTATTGIGAAAGFYGIHVDYSADAPLPRCRPWIAPPPADPEEVGGSEAIDPLDPLALQDPLDPDGLADPLDPSGIEPPATPTSDAVTAATNTVYLTDFARMRDLHGQDGVDEVLASIRALDGIGHVGDGAVTGAVLTVDGDPRVAAARAVLDADPCSVAARQALVREINRYVAAAIGAQRAHIEAIVIVGGDDVIPHAPIPQRAGTVAEAGHAGALRLARAAAGPCPVVPAGTVDPCATPQSAAAAGGFLLSDDPYALADAFPSWGGHLYVPTVGMGRLIDSPDEIRAQLDRFRRAEGLLEADSLLAAGYGPWADLSEALSAALSWRTGGGETLLEPGWTTADAEAAMSPADRSEAPSIIALNAVGDERRMASGATVTDAAPADAALEAEDHRPAPPPAVDARFDPFASAEEFEGALVMSLGCHSGVHLPESMYGSEPHWAATFTDAGAFVGTTGCGLADEPALGPSERLFSLYAGWIGVSGGEGPVSAGSALTYAKQSFLATAAQYTASDGRALEQTIFYGVPLYTFRGSTRQPPLPEPASDEGSGMLRLSPSLATLTLTDGGASRTFLTADGQDPLSVAGQPVLPIVTRGVPSTDGAGSAARGVLVTGLISEWRDPAEPAVAHPRTSLSPPATSFSAPPSAAALATVTQQTGPDGPATAVVATAARLSADGAGGSRFEVYPELELEVLYGDADDAVAPVITQTAGGPTFRAIAVDPSPSGSVTRALLLVAATDAGEGPQSWRSVELRRGDGDAWSTAVPSDVGPGYRWILQVVDDAGNVTTAHSDTP